MAASPSRLAGTRDGARRGPLPFRPRPARLTTCCKLAQLAALRITCSSRPSTITRITGSVPEGRSTTRPLARRGAARSAATAACTTAVHAGRVDTAAPLCTFSKRLRQCVRMPAVPARPAVRHGVLHDRPEPAARSRAHRRSWSYPGTGCGLRFPRPARRPHSISLPSTLTVSRPGARAKGHPRAARSASSSPEVAHHGADHRTHAACQSQLARRAAMI